MTADISFSRPVLAKLGAPIPECTTTIVEAIDAVFELRMGIEDKPHWQAALLALWSSYRDLRDSAKVGAAEVAFRDALAAEGWLGDLGA